MENRRLNPERDVARWVNSIGRDPMRMGNVAVDGPIGRERHQTNDQNRPKKENIKST